MTEHEQGALLLALARGAIAEHLGLGAAPKAKGEWLQQPAATFVTLMLQERLRGCIGSLQPQRALQEDVRANAVAAAFRDPRFPPLAEDELPHTRIEISLLSSQTALTFLDQRDALAQLRPGIDGVVLEYGALRSTFLPQVWEQLPAPETFMAQLKIKAGLPGDFWDPYLRLSRYTVMKWKDTDFEENVP